MGSLPVGQSVAVAKPPIALVPVGTLAAVARATRPRQWTKNLLLFGGLVFAAKLGDPARWLDGAAIFASFCAASGAAYLLNDSLDVTSDRVHPTKRFRPLAAGELSVRTALVAASVLALAAVALAATTTLLATGVAIGFLLLQVAYSTRLKHMVLLDVVAIALLFVARAAAGALAVDVRLSPWLILCTGLLALFLALAKRRGELVGGGEARTVLGTDGYSIALVDQLITICAAATIGAYGLYTFSAQRPAMMVTIPFVVYGLFRYLFLVHRADLGEEPDRILLTDRPILVTVAAWSATAAAIVAFT
jgi:4-hydroxybenzoate polyprenyltransferase